MQVDNSNNMTGVNNITPDGLVDGRDIAADGALLDTAEQTANKGVANGYAGLDGSGKISSSQLPTNMMEFEGDWNASTNTPTLANTDTDKKGTVYRVTVAGTVDFGAGNVTFAVGDWCYNNGSEWGQSDEQTISDTDALPEGSTNLYYTESRVSANTDVAANTTHRTSDGSDHTFIDQDVTIGSSPIFDASNFTGLPTTPQSFAFTRNNQRYVDTNDDEYQTVASPMYPGSDALGIPTTIEANCWNDGGTSISVRIIDLTNGDEVTPVVIAEATGITTSDEFNIEDLGSLSNIPTGSILLGVQLLLTGGGMGDDAAISSLTIK